MIRREVLEPNGFTLVELLVSLALMAMTAGLLAAGIGTGRNLWQRAETRVVAGESIAAAQSILRQRIEHLFAATRFGGSNPPVDVRGDSQQFSFFAVPLESQRPAGLQRFRIALDRSDTLILYSVDAATSRIDPNAPSVTGWSAAPLIGGVAALEIGYFGIAPPDNTRRWRAFWQERPVPPELVRVRLRFVDGDQRLWPDLVVRPQANVGTSCQLDKQAGRCRLGS